MYNHYYDARFSVIYFAAGDSEETQIFSGKINVFVCGALQNPDKMTSIIGRQAAFVPAALTGYGRGSEIIDGKEIPFMLPSDDPGHILTGIIWLYLSENELQKIEEIELKGNYRKRITIHARAGERRIDAYTYIKR